MELALQLQKVRVELDEGFKPFDPEKGIEVSFGGMNFITMGKLMSKAGELDEEIELAKSSKEAKGRIDPLTMGRKEKRPDEIGRTMVKKKAAWLSHHLKWGKGDEQAIAFADIPMSETYRYAEMC